MTKKKKIIIAVTASVTAVVVCAVALWLVLANGNYSETFAGILSEESYESVDEAAGEFIKNEISSSQNPVVFQSYTKEKELSERETAALNLELDGTVETVEVGMVKYAPADSYYRAASVKATDEEKSEKFVTVYIIIFKPTGAEIHEYKYYVPLPENGDSLSKSYYDSVLDPQKYSNCTVASTTKSIGYVGFIKQEVTIDYKLQISQKKVKYVITSKGAGASQLDLDGELYVTENESGILVGVVQKNGVSQFVSSIQLMNQYNLYSIEDVYKITLREFDFAFFEKTSNGFKIRDEYVDDMLSSALNSAGYSMSDTSGSYNFYVTEGRINSAKLIYQGKANYSGQSLKLKAENTVTYSNFGSTKVEFPDWVQKKLNANK